MNYYKFCFICKARSTSITIILPCWVIASLILPDALIRLAVAMLQLKIRAIPAIPYSRFRGCGFCSGFMLAAVVSRIRSTSSPTVKSIIRVFGFNIICDDTFEECLDAFRTANQ